MPSLTRSWSKINTKIEKGDVAYVKATYFNIDKKDKKYTDCLLLKNESILKGTILDVFSNTVKI